MNEKIEQNRLAFQQVTKSGQEASLRALKQYVANRQKTFSIFERLDSGSQQACDAQALLDKAMSDHAAFVTLINTIESQD